MSYIQTITGRIPSDRITFCHCHEHLMLRKGKSFDINQALCIDDYDKSLRELSDFHSAGGSTIIDAQPVGCGRMETELVALSKASGVHILASTGFHKMLFYPDEHWIFQYNCEKLTDLFLHELRTGMYTESDRSAPCRHMTAKAGIIKCAWDVCGLTKQYEKLFQAASDTARETQAPLMVHIESGSDPLALAEYLDKKQVPLDRVIFCHMDRACPDLSVHREICSRGIYLEYDTIGREKYHSDEREADIFAELIQAGYVNRLLFSLDTTRERLKAYNPAGVGLNYIMHTFIPLLKTRGITDTQIKKISCGNCRQIFSLHSHI